MSKHADLSAFHKVPGLFTAAEAFDVLEVDGDTLISRFGALADGTQLFEVYRRARPYRLDEEVVEQKAAP